MRKIVFLISSLFVSLNSFAVVYKCETKEGSVVYTNTQQKGTSCQKTEIENQIQSVYNKNKTSSSAATSTSLSNLPPSEREGKRIDILQKELDNEKQELETSKTKLSDLEKNKGSNNDINSTKDIIRIHEQNILTLEKEIGVKPSNTTLPQNNKKNNTSDKE